MKKNKSEMDYIYDELDMMSEEELNREMEMILAEVAEDESVADAEPPKELYEAVSKEIHELENARARERLSDEDKELLQYGKLYKKQLKSRKYFVLAAVLILTLACGMTSMGGPRKTIEWFSMMLLGRENIIVNSHNENILSPNAMDEEKAYIEIEKRFGFKTVRLNYLPEGAKFEELSIGDEIQGVQILYSKNDKIIIDMRIQTNNLTNSLGYDIEDEFVKSFVLENKGVDIVVSEHQVANSTESRWRATFEYQDVKYFMMFSELSEEEIIKIVNNIVFA